MSDTLMSMHRGIKIWFTDSGDYMVVNGYRKVRFPTEKEACEYIDEEMDIQKYEEAGL